MCCTIHKNRCTGFYKKGAHFFISIFSNYLPLFSSFNTSGFFFNSENWAPFLRQTVYVEKSQYCFFTKPSSSQARNFSCIYTELSKQQKQTEIRKNKILSRNQKKIVQLQNSQKTNKLANTVVTTTEAGKIP